MKCPYSTDSLVNGQQRIAEDVLETVISRDCKLNCVTAI